MPDPQQAKGPATLVYGETALELPAEQPTLGRTALDVSSLAQHGLSVFDPGYADTAAYHSAITFVDGEAGRLYYRGYPVEQLATTFSFLQVAYLLIYGELPTAAEADAFVASVRDPKLVLHVGIERLFDSFPQSMHPMAMLAIATEALSVYADDGPKSDNRARVEHAGRRLLSAIPIFTGYALSTLRGLPRGKSNRSLDYAEDLLQLCFAIPGSDHLPDDATARPSTHCLSSTRTTSSIARLPPCAWWPHRAPGSMQACLPPLMPSGDLCTAGPTRRSSKCSRRSRIRVGLSATSWARRKIATTPSA